MAYDGAAEENASEGAGIVIPIVQVADRETPPTIEFESITVEWNGFTITVEVADWYLNEKYGSKILRVFGTIENSRDRDYSDDELARLCLLVGGESNVVGVSYGLPILYDPSFDFYGNFEARNEHTTDTLPANGKVRFYIADAIPADKSFDEIDFQLAAWSGSRYSNPFHFAEQ